MRKNRGVTLISLVIMIVILIILAGIAINIILNGGIIKNANISTEKYNKEQATEVMNLKITNIQMKTFAEKQKMPTLQQLADELCDDGEMEYVRLKSENEYATILEKNRGRRSKFNINKIGIVSI